MCINYACQKSRRLKRSADSCHRRQSSESRPKSAHNQYFPRLPNTHVSLNITRSEYIRIPKLQLSEYCTHFASALWSFSPFWHCPFWQSFKSAKRNFRHIDVAPTHIARRKWPTKWRRRFEMAAGQRCQAPFQGAHFKCSNIRRTKWFVDQIFIKSGRVLQFMAIRFFAHNVGGNWLSESYRNFL